MIQPSPKGLLCSNHPKRPKENGYYRDYYMQESKVTYLDKKDKTKTIVEEYLTCPRCHQCVRITPDIRILLDGYKNGIKTDTVTVRKSDLVDTTGTQPRTDQAFA